MARPYTDPARFTAAAQWTDADVHGMVYALYHCPGGTLSGDLRTDVLIVRSGLETGILTVAALLASPDAKVRVATQIALSDMPPRVAEEAMKTTEERAHATITAVKCRQARLRISKRGISRLVPLVDGIELPPQPVDVLPTGRRAA